jgi:enoyl-CoA hydratase/carnithine racemase
MRGDLAAQVERATAREEREQQRLRDTDDFREGVAAVAERRPPSFTGQ